jgi:hypothetical protein
MPLWRVFPWDEAAAPGERHSALWIASGQGRGRFDMPHSPSGVLYLAESPDHAIAESLQQYRGQTLDAADLMIAGHPLAVVSVSVPSVVLDGVADLCDAAVLLKLNIRPDQTASSDRRTTQQIAARVHAAGYTGLRWWSALKGDWHCIVLFCERLRDALSFGPPRVLTLADAEVAEAARALGITRRRISVIR